MNATCPYCHQTMADAAPKQVLELLDLPPHQNKVLQFLWLHRGAVVETWQMMHELYGDTIDGPPPSAFRSLKVTIYKIRKALPAGFRIEVVRGCGYRLAVAS